MSPELRALRLLRKLSGEAFEKMEAIEESHLRHEDGIARFKEAIEEAYEPSDD